MFRRSCRDFDSCFSLAYQFLHLFKNKVAKIKQKINGKYIYFGYIEKFAQ